ncbi:MAG TPA: serine/threonine-protein kinase [Bryobacteraceae bacterium]|nr:serine/threonine-protein kinase [Bryobacteraceae bacterium]
MNPVGRYQIAGEIGRGAMGVVYKALDPAIGRTVAIKTIHLTDLTDTNARQRVGERLLLEAQSAGTLSHPNIVTVFDVLTQDDFVYIVMEFVPGPSLDEMLRQHQIPERDELLVYLRQVAQALDYAHRKGVIHRDVKPANILISATGVGSERVAKITDFGVAKTLTEGSPSSGSVTGTPNYLSPEQIEGGTVNGQSDQFSLAVVVYELLSGHRPFEAESVAALFQQICAGEARPIEESDPTLSPTVGKVMARALSRRVEERFPSVSDFIGALSIALGEAQSAASFAGGRDTATYLLPGDRPQWVTFSKNQPGGGTATPSYSEAVWDEYAQPATGRKKLALIMLLCFAVAAAVVFIVRLNSGSAVPVQILDPNASPASPPPVADTQRSAAPAISTRDKTPPTAAPAPTPAKPAAAPPEDKPSPAATVPVTRPQIKQPENSGIGGTSTADVDLVSEPTGARIVVDGREDATCNAPCTMSLPVGRHTLTADLKGYTLARRIFNLPETSRLLISMSQDAGVLVLTSVPAGSSVFVDGKLYGQTPATLHLSAGVHQILLVNGIKRRQETINIDPDSFLTRSVTW